MFNGASRRACAYASKQLPHRPLITRSITSTTISRPAIQYTRQSFSPIRLQKGGRSQTRHLTFGQKVRLGYREASKGIWRKNPILLPLAVISAVGATVLFAYIAYNEVTHVGPQFHKFPPPVADALRTAVYYTEIDLNPPKALKAYKEALRIAIELGMHPYSDEMLGIRLQVAMMLEKAGLVKPAIEVLERTKAESVAWIEEGRKKKLIQDKEAEVEKKKEKKPDTTVEIDDPEILEMELKKKELEEFEERQRDKALKKVVGMQMKLAELYASEYIQDEKKAEESQVAAVELALKEMRRRQSLGLPVGAASNDSDAWLNLTEIATALVELASTYTSQEKHDLAMPLYLRALDMIHAEEGDSPSCKQVVLLNDVASAMAGQAQRPIRSTSNSPQQQAVSRDQVVEAARQWAQKSIDVAARITPPVRDQDCDMTCVVATYNLGELAELQNKRDEAERRYREALSLAKGIGFDDGVTMAETALKRLTKK